MPYSSLDLAQERLGFDPWGSALAARLCVRVSGRRGALVAMEVVRRWPTPAALLMSPPEELEEVLRPLGLQRRRARALLRDAERRLSTDLNGFISGLPAYAQQSVMVACLRVPVESQDPYVSALSALLKEGLA